MRKDEAVGNKKKMQVCLPKQLTEKAPVLSLDESVLQLPGIALPPEVSVLQQPVLSLDMTALH
jgi:hypothetical protein